MRIELLEDKHIREGFQCSNPIFTEYLIRYAKQDQRRNLCRCFVLRDETCRVLGYYTLNATGIDLSTLQPFISRRQLGCYPKVPAFLLGRLAIHEALKGNGFGSLLLLDAIKRSMSNELCPVALIADAIDLNAVQFYKRHGFVEYEKNRVFLSLKQ